LETQLINSIHRWIVMPVEIEDLRLIGEMLKSDVFFYKDKTIFLTGGTGFFGKWLLEAFIYLNKSYSTNISITILTRSPRKFIKEYPYLGCYESFKFIQGDIRDFSCVNENFDLIIHAATDASVDLNKLKPELMRSTIMDGTKRICEFAKAVNCKRILYTSSGAAYGLQPEDLPEIPETFVDDSKYDYNDAYASAKLESEAYFKKYANCDVVIARCFAFSGPYLPLNGSYAFGNFIDDVLNERDIVIKGDGTATRSYLYAADLIIWLLRLLSAGKNKEIYNVGSDEAISIAKLADKISSNCVKKNNVKILGVGSTNKSQYVPSIKKAKMELKLERYTSLDLAIQKTLRFYSI